MPSDRPGHGTVTRHVTRQKPHQRRGSSSRMPATAAIDNETLDHLLSFVEDRPNIAPTRRFGRVTPNPPRPAVLIAPFKPPLPPAAGARSPDRAPRETATGR